MKLVSFLYLNAGRSATLATDLDMVEFIKYLRNSYSHDAAITYVVDMTESDFRRWQAEGLPSMTKQQQRLQQLER